MNQTVLVLDDHKMITDLYTVVLKKLKIFSRIVRSHSLHEAYTAVIEANLISFTLAVLDFSMIDDKTLNLKNGEDIALLIRSNFPEAKIIFISGLLNDLQLKSLIKTINPEGIVEKVDINFTDLSTIFRIVLQGEVYYSSSIEKRICENFTKYIYFDDLNLKIIQLIHKGVLTKNLPLYLPLSLSAIHKRKAKIRNLLYIDDGADEAIINEAIKRGLI